MSGPYGKHLIIRTVIAILCAAVAFLLLEMLVAIAACHDGARCSYAGVTFGSYLAGMVAMLVFTGARK